MKKILTFMACAAYIAVHAQQHIDITCYTAEPWQPTTPDSLSVVVWENFFSEAKKMTLPHSTYSEYPVYGSGYVHFRIEGVKSPVYISIGHGPVDNQFLSILDAYLAEPGDSITIVNLGGINTRFYGKGSAKYNCRYTLDNETAYLKDETDTIGQPGILQQYLHQMPTRDFNILRANMIGRHHNALVTRVFYQSISDPVTTGELAQRTHEYKKLVQQLALLPQNLPALCYAKDYCYFLMQKAVCEEHFFKRRSAYSSIKQNYSGALRDRILGCLFMEKNDRLAKEDSLLQDAFSYMQDTACKNSLAAFFDHQKIGSSAYDFALPDTAKNIRRLSEFKGKTVYLDFWFTGCSNCRAYYSQTVSKAEEFFDRDTSVVFVTISIDRDFNNWKKGIYKNEYTSPKMVNLNTNGRYTDDPSILNYGVGGYPHPVIVDKYGKIFYSQIDDLVLGGPSKLIATIQAAQKK